MIPQGQENVLASTLSSHQRNYSVNTGTFLKKIPSNGRLAGFGYHKKTPPKVVSQSIMSLDKLGELLQITRFAGMEKGQKGVIYQLKDVGTRRKFH
jgi:hypothetical protein